MTKPFDDSNGAYYAVIPATVRYDGNLTILERMLYGEITCFADEYGRCYAPFSYFAKLYGVTENDIDTCIRKLNKCNYISIESDPNEHRNIKAVFLNA